ncbi:MFS transporter [Aliivibrio fischeri]|uniref:MFS transporter n=1 Tax=Aliivibrio fischeri TaxID=668 RepID=UPI0012D9B8C6|nr:MFS transporter [Aliivibrio fischeri]MUK68450.1 MFS transporter [Aliivibrio fischeri]MUK73686.1 MFS transporter [Aliivibrio fischeri]MUK75913.1 MFS transporter [Aliivibrio fischeri]
MPSFFDKNTHISIQLIIIGLVAALMGIGQNGLLVSLPFLVTNSAFALPTWSIIIAVGSFLFLPSAPFWGKYSDKKGPKCVVLQALFGMSFSFLLLLTFTFLSNDHPNYAGFCLIGLIIARVIYGCTVSGMVPASQHWAILLCGEENRLQAITSVSIGLSLGRLLGPILSILLLKSGPYSPLIMMVCFPLLALFAAFMLPNPSQINNHNKSSHQVSSFIPSIRLMPYLLTGLFLCLTIALLQYSFSPLIESITDWSPNKISDVIGILLTISATVTLITQVFVIKKKKIQITTMYYLGAICLLLGYLIFTLHSIWLLGIGMAITACGAALLVPVYTTKATSMDKDNPGSVAGYISMSHTLGYGIASLFAYTATISPIYPIYICILFSVGILVIAFMKPQINKA